MRPGTRRKRMLALASLALAAACGRFPGGPASAVGDEVVANHGPASGESHAGHHASAEPGGGAAAAVVEPTPATHPLAVVGEPATVPPAPPTTTTTAPAATAPPAPARLNLYAETTAGKLSAGVRDVPLRVYVPNSEENTLSVIDPASFTVVARIPTGQLPHHVTPSWDLQTLYVLNTAGNSIIPIDPRTATAAPAIPVVDPYNLYFTPDGSTAIVVAERFRRLDLLDPRTWQVSGSIPVPFAGVDHGDFSADGRYFYASCEFSGWLVKVDLLERRIVADRQIGSQPIDVKMAPDASLLYVADQARHGVVLVDPGDLHEVAFLPTGRGAHGLYPSRDTTKLYVSNRLGGSVSVVDFATNRIEATWPIPGGGSPDMGGVSPDGSQLWLSGRHHGEVYVFDTRTGQLITRIRTGAGAHGLAIFPQPGRYSLGHTGVYR